MADNKKQNTVLHKRSTKKNVLPKGETLQYGEIAVNYNAEAPFLSIRKDGDAKEYAKFIDEAAIEAKFEENEEVIAAALTTLDGRIDEIESKQEKVFIIPEDFIEENYGEPDENGFVGKIKQEYVTDILENRYTKMLDIQGGNPQVGEFDYFYDHILKLKIRRIEDFPQEIVEQIQIIEINVNRDGVDFCKYKMNAFTSYFPFTYSIFDEEPQNSNALKRLTFIDSFLSDGMNLPEENKQFFKKNMGSFADWNAQEGEVGYIENRSHYKNITNRQFERREGYNEFEDYFWHEWGGAECSDPLKIDKFPAEIQIKGGNYGWTVTLGKVNSLATLDVIEMDESVNIAKVYLEEYEGYYYLKISDEGYENHILDGPLNVTYNEYIPLHEKYIPNTIARKSDLEGINKSLVFNVDALSDESIYVDENSNIYFSTEQVEKAVGVSFEELWKYLEEKNPIDLLYGFIYYGITYGITPYDGAEDCTIQYQTSDNGQILLLKIMKEPMEVESEVFARAVLTLKEPTDSSITPIKEELANKADKADIVTPDWNAKEGKAGYIENRTHYLDIIGGETLKDISVASDIYADSKLKSHNKEFITETGGEYFMKLVYEQGLDTYIESLYIGEELIKAVQGKPIYYNGEVICQFDYSYDSSTDKEIFTSTIWINVDYQVDTLEDDELLEYAKEKAKESILVYDVENISLNKYFIKKVLEDKYLPNTIARTSALVTKQDKLESGINIKTINGENILGEGNIEVGNQFYLDLSNLELVSVSDLEMCITLESLESAVGMTLAEFYNLAKERDIMVAGGDSAFYPTSKAVDTFISLQYDPPTGTATSYEKVFLSIYPESKEVTIDGNVITYGATYELIVDELKFKTINGEEILGEGNIEIGIDSPFEKGDGEYSAIQDTDKTTFTDDNSYSSTHTQEISIEASGAYSLALGEDSNASGKRALAHGHYSIARGTASHAEGHCCVVDNIDDTHNGYGAHVEGYMTYATGPYSHAEGSQTSVLGANSHAEGAQTIANSENSHAEGYLSKTEGSSSHAEGNNTLTTGAYSHSEGFETKTIGQASHAEGQGSISQGDYSHSEGSATANGFASHAEGAGSTTIGGYSHAEGNTTTASGQYSHSEGWVSNAIGDNSHAEGQNTRAHGIASHSEGNNTDAYGNANHTEGLGTKTNEGVQGQHAEGHFNFVGDGVLLVGCGTSNEDRKNAIEAKQDGEIYIKGIGGYEGTNTNDAKDVATYLPNMVEITYSDLVELKGNYVPGQQYRITDYVTTTSQSNTQSAGHQFDIIVTADDESTLNENARAILHEGDTYFSNSDLNAWEIKYCIDNDFNRFKWAYSGNGKGVIYYMKDEHGNECPYDFKNIMFKHPNNTSIYPDYYYTFTNLISGTVSDKSITLYCYNNVIKEYINSQKLHLNNNVFINTFNTSTCHSNSFGNDCYNNSFGYGCESNSFGNGCDSNSFGYNCDSISFGDNCHSNSFGDNCYSNTFGNACSRNSFGYNSSFNSFGNNCSSNTFGDNCNDNSFGNNCDSNSFRMSAFTGSDLKSCCSYNHFDDGCSYNVVWNANNTSSSIKLQNINVKRGVSGTLSEYNYINIGVLNAGYEITVAKNTSGVIKIYCEADLIL